MRILLCPLGFDFLDILYQLLLIWDTLDFVLDDQVIVLFITSSLRMIDANVEILFFTAYFVLYSFVRKYRLATERLNHRDETAFVAVP